MKHLLFFGNAGIGNFLQYLPAIRFLKKQRPEIGIHCVTLNPCLEEIAKSCDFVDAVNNLAKITPKVFFNNVNCDTALITLHDSYLYPVMLTFLMRAKQRIGFESIAHWQNKYRFLLTNRVAVNEIMKETSLYSQLLKPLGLIMEEENRPFFPSFEEIKPLVDKWWEKNIDDAITIGLHAATSPGQTWKNWGVDKFRSLSLKLLEAMPAAKLIFFGSANNMPQLNKITSVLQKTRFVNVINRPLPEVGAIINKCSLLVCNDSGIMHIADALGTKIIAIFGPTDHRLVAPLPPAEIVRYPLECSPCYTFPGDQKKPVNCSHRICLENISVDMIFNKIIKTLKVS